MKTAISIPDETFHRASIRARALGMSRSRFITTAVERYLDALDGESLTTRIDAAYALAVGDTSGTAAVAAGRRVLVEGDDW